MRLILSFLLVSASLSLWAQATVSPVQVTKRPGEVVTIQVNYEGTGTAGVQWATTQTGGTLQNMASTVGPALTDATKELFCNGLTCLGVGMNQNVIQPGVLAVMTGTVPAGQRAPIVMSLAIGIAVDATGDALPIIVNQDVLITVIVPEDLNGDGVVNHDDLALLADQATGKTPCGSADLNADGKCDLRDALRLISAATIP